MIARAESCGGAAALELMCLVSPKKLFSAQARTDQDLAFAHVALIVEQPRAHVGELEPRAHFAAEGAGRDALLHLVRQPHLGEQALVGDPGRQPEALDALLAED